MRFHIVMHPEKNILSKLSLIKLNPLPHKNDRKMAKSRLSSLLKGQYLQHMTNHKHEQVYWQQSEEQTITSYNIRQIRRS